jgi:hypothetical protein
VLEPESGVFRSLNASVEGIAGRNPDGSIDYGYYRRQASRLRRAKLRESSRRAARFAGLIVAITIVAAAIVAVTARGPQFSAGCRHREFRSGRRSLPGERGHTSIGPQMTNAKH